MVHERADKVCNECGLQKDEVAVAKDHALPFVQPHRVVKHFFRVVDEHVK